MASKDKNGYKREFKKEDYVLLYKQAIIINEVKENQL